MSATAGLTGVDFDWLRDFVRERSAIEILPDQGYLVDTRLSPLARAQGLDLPSLVARLRSATYGELAETVIDAFTTNETSWFRDTHPFESLRDQVLPELAGPARGPVKVWCAACSSGQEPYTVAMVLREHFASVAANRATAIEATDLSPVMVARTRAGRYSDFEMSRGMPDELKARYFTPDGRGHWVVRDDLRRMVNAHELNLIAPSWQLGQPFDLVMLRNVLIYFNQPTRDAILRRVRATMRTGGYLLLGSAETVQAAVGGFERVLLGRTSYYRAI